MNNVHLVTELLVENRYLAAQLFNKMISKEPIHVQKKCKAVVSLQPIFIIPIELPIDGEVFFL
jgi:nitrogen fixation protein FixH